MSRIYTHPLEAVREIERELTEMGIQVHPQTMQDKEVGDDPDYETRELQAYLFRIHEFEWSLPEEYRAVIYLYDTEEASRVMSYIEAEYKDRVSGKALNPGNSHIYRDRVWTEFRAEDGTFSYTYSERLAPQLAGLVRQFKINPNTRQGILQVFSAIHPQQLHPAIRSLDHKGMGGNWRIPCSMHYQMMIRHGRLDMVYVMRSCDFLIHFVIDLMLALRIQGWFAQQVGVPTGQFSYFAGSLHAYQKDLKERKAF